MQELPQPGIPPAAVGGLRGANCPAVALDNPTLDEERREIVAAVLAALTGHAPDPDEMAACSYLLKHLSQNSRPPGFHAA